MTENDLGLGLCARAWTIIANAGGGNWKHESPEWQRAAASWRDSFHEQLDQQLDRMEKQMDAAFTSHKLNDQGLAKAKGIAEAFDELLSKLSPVCSAGRELALSRTHLEEACFFAKKAMAINPENQG